MKKNENENVKGVEDDNIEDLTKMTEKRVDGYLADLSDTPFWQALLIRIRAKDYQSIAALATLDPFKNPTEVARNQGIRMGLYYIENEIARAKAKRTEKSKDE